MQQREQSQSQKDVQVHMPTTEDKTVPADAEESHNHEEIAKLAYCYYEERGFGNGNPEEDWYRAEKRIRHMHEERSSAAAHHEG